MLCLEDFFQRSNILYCSFPRNPGESRRAEAEADIFANNDSEEEPLQDEPTAEVLASTLETSVTQETESSDGVEVSSRS
ncbi:MAG: hypothetical protein M1833_001016 [Piccolia ochrophora]|nr:MAG: hypothetical protein M1833_001016 [Piccolia ochrophora]